MTANLYKDRLVITKNRLPAIGWVLTLFLPWALVAFGTVTQGDDDAWRASLFFFAPVVAVGFVLLGLSWRRLGQSRWMGCGHIVTLILAVRILPAYWTRVTLARDHIGAGFSTDYIRSFEPEWWHFYWAPVMTFLVICAVLFNVVAWVSRPGERRR